MEERPPGWHRFVVGGLWDEMGQRQLDFLVRSGLRPHHDLLDIGCGSLRAGVKLIAYLEAGHYYGVDRDAQLLQCGQELELSPDLRQKMPVLAQMEDFELDRLGRCFDFAIAQSVFTHLPINRIARCLSNVTRVLAPHGVLYATFFENERGPHDLEPLRWGTGADGQVVTTYPDRDPYHYDIETFEWLSRRTGLRLDRVGDWGHPLGQRMLAFRPRSRWFSAPARADRRSAHHPSPSVR